MNARMTSATTGQRALSKLWRARRSSTARSLRLIFTTGTMFGAASIFGSIFCTIVAPLSQPNTRIKLRVEQIDDQVQPDEEHGK